MKIKDIKNALLDQCGFIDRKREQNRIPRVLFYHGVADIRSPFVEKLHIPPADFRKQLAYLRKHYEIVSIDEYDRRWQTGSFTGREITLTFDDGYRNNLTQLAPILKEYDLPFTVFISTRHIDSGKRFSTFVGRAVLSWPSLDRLQVECLGLESPLTSAGQRKKIFKQINRHLKHADIQTVNLITEQLIQNLPAGEYRKLCDYYQADALMSWEDVATLQKEYRCTVGSHCLDHFICGTFQQEAEIIRQIEESKSVIEQKLGSPCHYLAYPNGDTCPIALEAARKAGYRMAFTTANKRLSSRMDPMELPRYGVNFNYPTFKADLALKPDNNEDR